MSSGSIHDESQEITSATARREDRYQAIVAYLSAEEKSALRELDYDPIRRRLPSAQALRLLSLGLAELSCGRLALTGAGKGALAALRTRPPVDGGADGNAG